VEVEHKTVNTTTVTAFSEDDENEWPDWPESDGEQEGKLDSRKRLRKLSAERSKDVKTTPKPSKPNSSILTLSALQDTKTPARLKSVVSTPSTTPASDLNTPKSTMKRGDLFSRSESTERKLASSGEEGADGVLEMGKHKHNR
jgi:hypothetical protein